MGTLGGDLTGGNAGELEGTSKGRSLGILQVRHPAWVNQWVPQQVIPWENFLGQSAGMSDGMLGIQLGAEMCLKLGELDGTSLRH